MGKLRLLHFQQKLPNFTLERQQSCNFSPSRFSISLCLWRALTECGPLEKEMANHFSILPLRTP